MLKAFLILLTCHLYEKAESVYKGGANCQSPGVRPLKQLHGCRSPGVEEVWPKFLKALDAVELFWWFPSLPSQESLCQGAGKESTYLHGY